MKSLSRTFGTAIARARSALLARARRGGVRPPRAYWSVRYMPARVLARAGMSPASARTRSTERDVPGEPRLPPRAPTPLRPVALFYAINGSGLGHVSRALAIARHLRDLTPVFVTTSARTDVLDERGISYRALPPWELAHAADPRMSRARWNEDLSRILHEEFERHRPALIVFDGVAADRGLATAWRAFPAAGRVGIRRAYRLDGREKLVVLRDAELDLMLIPHEEGTERIPIPPGPVARWVGSIVSSSKDEARPAAEARRELDLPTTGICVLVQLGSGAFGSSRHFIGDLVRSLAALDADVVVTRFGDEPSSTRVHPTDRFPIAPLLGAFDLAVAAAGYNTYTELMHHGIPTVFVPNEHTLSDDQSARALRSARAGAAFAVKERDVAAMVRAARKLIDDPVMRARMADRARALVPSNGGPEAARSLEAYAERILKR